MSLVFTPKQVAQALGVSESSVKRWVDAGKLQAVKTLGGHRKISLEDVSRFVRDSGQEVARPELIGMVATTAECDPKEYRDILYRKMIAGDQEGVRRAVVGLYQGGASVADLGDRLVQPVLSKIEYDGRKGNLQEFQQSQSSLALAAALHDVRALLGEPKKQWPLALCASVAPDEDLAPVRLAQLALHTANWRAIAVGAGLPAEEILSAAQSHQPELVCLVATFSAPVSAIRRLRHDFPTRTRLAAVGDAIDEAWAGSLGCNLAAQRLEDLVEQVQAIGRASTLAPGELHAAHALASPHAGVISPVDATVDSAGELLS